MLLLLLSAAAAAAICSVSENDLKLLNTFKVDLPSEFLCRSLQNRRAWSPGNTKFPIPALNHLRRRI